MLIKKLRRDQYIAFGPYIIVVACGQLLAPDQFAKIVTILIPYY